MATDSRVAAGGGRSANPARLGGQRAATAAEAVDLELPATPPRSGTQSGHPLEEYKSVGEFMRLYATLRFYRLALLLGTTGSIVTALTSIAVRSNFARPEILKLGGLVISMAFLVMEYRATSHWLLLRSRCNELARVLRYQPVPCSSRWHPLTTSGAGFYLYAAVLILWGASLLFRLDRVL